MNLATALAEVRTLSDERKAILLNHYTQGVLTQEEVDELHEHLSQTLFGLNEQMAIVNSMLPQVA